MSKTKARLGRGLTSLLQTFEEPIRVALPPPPPPVQAESNAMFHVELSQVKPNPHQPRRHFDDAELRSLGESLRRSGLIQPIIVQPTENGYLLIAGERRFRAAQMAGIDRLPAVVRHVEPVEQAELALIENIHRSDLNAIERATAYRQLVQDFGLTQEQLAERLGEDRSSIANHLRLLELAEPVRAMVVDRRLTLGHAKVLAGVEDVLRQVNLAEKAVQEDWSVRKLEEATKSQEPIEKVVGVPSPHLRDLERRLTDGLRMKVQVNQSGTKGKGKLTIHYGNLDQFDELISRLGVSLSE